MILTEKHIIRKSNRNFKRINELCFLSKNLYNCILYKSKQEYLKTGKFLRYRDLEKSFRAENNKDYFSISTATSQQILIQFDNNLKAYFKLLKMWKKNKKSLNGCPRFQKYKDKIKGRNIYIIRGDTLRFKNELIHFPKKDNILPIKSKAITSKEQKIKQIRIIPRASHYVIEIIYEKKELKRTKNKNFAAIDLGINNLMAITTNTKKSLLVNGKPLKSINQYFNKKKARIQSELKKNHNKYNSNKLNSLQLKRDNKIKDYLHKTSRLVVNYLKKENISKVAIGYNKEWKQECEMGKKNNQTFISIPHLMLLNLLKYKLNLVGIELIPDEEAYTSKCSALDLEKIQKHDIYLGRRSKRGLFITSDGKMINADGNGSLNIGRKAFGDAFVPADIGFVFNPVKV